MFDSSSPGQKPLETVERGRAPIPWGTSHVRGSSEQGAGPRKTHPRRGFVGVTRLAQGRAHSTVGTPPSGESVKRSLRPGLAEDLYRLEPSVPMPALPTPQPTCPHCRHLIDPKSDILYQGMGAVVGLSVAYCGWCGGIFSVGQWTTLIGKK